MKPILNFLFLFLILNSTSQSQNQFNVRQANSPNSASIYEIKFIDSLRGVGVSTSDIYITNDAGENWSLKFTIPTIMSFFKINSDADSIFITGLSTYFGPVIISFNFQDTSYHTIDYIHKYQYALHYPIFFNDTLWENGISLRYPGVFAVRDSTLRQISNRSSIVSIVDDKIMLIYSDTMLLSRDSSKTWDTIQLPISATEALMINDSVIIINDYDRFNSSSIISTYRTENSGLNWTYLGSNSMLLPKKIYWSEGNVVAGIGDSSFFYSTDGGLTFSKTNLNPVPNISFVLPYSNNKYFVCSGNNIYILEKSSITGIESIKKEDFKVFPNPTSGILEIEPTRLEEAGSYMVYDISGNLLVETSGRVIDLTEFKDGIYIIQYKSEGRTYSRKVIKQAE